MKQNKVLFLDRDGIINFDYGYVGTIERFKLVDGIIDLCSNAVAQGYKIIIITNQAGIAKNKFTLQNFINLSLYMIEIFKNHNIDINIYFCPYHIEAVNNHYTLNTVIQKEFYPLLKEQKIINNIFLSQYRKPSSGMILQAQKRFNINLTNSFFIGDQETDMISAVTSGIPIAILVNKDISSKYTQNIFARLPTFQELLSLSK